MEAAIREAEQVILGELKEDECYEAVFNARFGQGYPCSSCGRATRWFRLNKIRAYSCQYCGNHLHPTAGTLIEGTKLPMRYWLLATYLQKIQTNGVSAVDLKRRLPISYLTARRVSRIIRNNIAPGSVLCYRTALSIPSLLVDISKASEPRPGKGLISIPVSREGIGGLALSVERPCNK